MNGTESGATVNRAAKAAAIVAKSKPLTRDSKAGEYLARRGIWDVAQGRPNLMATSAGQVVGIVERELPDACVQVIEKSTNPDAEVPKRTIGALKRRALDLGRGDEDDWHDGEGNAVCILAEGPEDALSAIALGVEGRPFAALGVGNLRHFRPPEWMGGCVIVQVIADVGPDNERVAAEACRELDKAGHRPVLRIPTNGTDANDVLMAGAGVLHEMDWTHFAGEATGDAALAMAAGSDVAQGGVKFDAPVLDGVEVPKGPQPAPIKRKGAKGIPPVTHIIEGLTVTRAELTGHRKPYRIEGRLHKELQAAAIESLRAAAHDAISEVARQTPGAKASDWGPDEVERSLIEDGDYLDTSKPWNLGYEGHVRVGATLPVKPKFVDLEAKITLDKANIMAASTPGALVNLKISFNAVPKKEDKGAALYTNIHWIQLVGQSDLPDLGAVAEGTETDAPTVDGEEVPDLVGRILRGGGDVTVSGVFHAQSTMADWFLQAYGRDVRFDIVHGKWIGGWAHDAGQVRLQASGDVPRATGRRPHSLGVKRR